MSEDFTRAEDLDTVLQSVIDSVLANVHTVQVGQVVSFDAAKQTCTVQPCAMRVYTGQDPIALPPIEDVPVVYPGSGDWWITFELVAGQYVLLVFAERSIAKWLNSGGVSDPQLSSKFDLSDAIAIPGINPYPGALTPGVAAGALMLRNRAGNTSIKLETGKATVDGDLEVTGKITADGEIKSYTNIKAATAITEAPFVTLKNHVHGGVTVGSGVTAIPTPGA